ncbi:Histone acetyltransferase type B subunit 2 [Astathelohania contejeani]|uniref:Histone acetyltransferase type B subunit 2 n=1 Tax=Astathelohania contejeani TaxID=164912 RepID=A0ABQ7I1J7_9MICR|nr:Histone acetyltransferase type B subunit 2 [Thelohania contejeani]
MNEYDDVDQKIINEEYKIWRKNVPYLYDMVLTHSLQWPSLSIQWFPEATRDAQKGMTTQRLLLSTHTSGKDDEFLEIASITLPDEVTESILENFQEEKPGAGDARFKTTQKIQVLNEINRTRYCPQMCNVIATRSDDPEIHIYDYTKHRSEGRNDKPDMILQGHESGGYGLSWNKQKKGMLATSGSDNLVCLYDINENVDIINPLLVLNGHTAVVGDVCFNHLKPDIFASVGDDKKILFWDGKSKNPTLEVKDAHSSDIYCIDFSPTDENVLATGSKDTSVKVWDMRNAKEPLYVLTSHKKDILQVQWSPHFGNILASSGSDRRVCIWDLSKVGVQMSEEDAQDGPSELLFLHGGHTNTVCDFSWNPLEPWEIASVAEDNIVQIWQISNKDA